MSDGAIDLAKELKAKVAAMALDDINVADSQLFQSDTLWPYFERLRNEDPVHLHPAEHHKAGAFWSITRFEDIVAVDTDHETFSSSPIIVLEDPISDFDLPMFIAMDPPKHDIQRKTVSPIVSPANLKAMEALIRGRIQTTLDSLPIGTPFDWVDLVSKELTSQMLATLFDYPFERRRELTFWSDLISAEPDSPLWTTDDTETEFKQRMMECAFAFTQLWNERVNSEPKGDLISMLAQGEATKDMTPMEFLGNVILLIVGGNDTTRNTMSASVYELNRNPQERAKLYANPALIPSMVSETIRYQTPLPYMRRTATRDVELHGKTIKKGDKVAMWYVSGNRDERVIDRPNDYIIDRPNVRHHVSFGFGIHRCVGNRLAELQLRILWEEIMLRFPEINVISAKRVKSIFVRGFEHMEVVIPRKL
jgi:cytochrome P450